MNKIRIGQGYDVHALTAGTHIRLGGVDIPHDKSCVAHSDGDVVLHAICDALLGAAALGDIGTHFPDTSPEFKGIDSMELLRRTVELIHRDGYKIGNLDITIIAQAPKLAPHIAAMRLRIADATGMTVDNLSVKATTTEHLGFEGRQEGIAALAVALINL
jgi:2-C-methyl-D-erythritol 2,4-cyclodiphosphate synthase